MEKRAAKMKVDLSLTQEQSGRIDGVNDQFQQKQARLLADTSMTRENIRLERKRMLDERNSKIKGVLTEEQYVKWTSTTRKQTPERTSRRPSNPLDEMLKELDLTNDQRKQAMTIHARMAARLKKMRSDTTINRENIRPAIKKITDERNL